MKGNRNMKKKSFYYIAPFLLALVFAVIAYQFYPINGNYDLSKYYYLMNMVKIKDAASLIYLKDYIEIFFRFYMYLISILGNYRLLQFFPVLIFYWIAFYIIFDYCKEHSVDVISAVLATLFFCTLFKFVFIASSIRYPLAYMIFALGLYLDLVKNKKNLWVKTLYIIPIFIHKTSILLLLFRLLVEIKNKKILYFIFIIFTSSFFFPNIIINLLTPFKNIPIFTQLINMMYGYLVSEKVPIYMQLIFRLFQTIFLVFSGIVCYKYQRSNENIKKYNMLLVLVGIFSIFLFKYFTMFMRMIDFLLFLAPLVLLQFLQFIKNKYNKYYLLTMIILTLFIGCGIYIQIGDFIEMFL